MKRLTGVLTLAAAALWSVGAFAQGRNFAGSWTVDSEKTKAAAAASGAVVSAGGGGGFGGGAGGGMRSGGGGFGGSGGGARVSVSTAMTISIDANSFAIEQGGTSTTYHLDGSTTIIETPRGNSTARASWKGDTLVVETTSEGPNGSIVSTSTWSLEGDSLVRESGSPSANGTTAVRKTYYKRS